MVNIWSFFGQLIGERCPLCQAPADGICPPCRQSLPLNRHACPRCALPMATDIPDDLCCRDCQSRPPAFHQALAPLLYRPPVDDLVAGLKYHHRLALSRVLADLFAEAATGRESLPQILLPVPMHPSKLRRRGFNQALELARHLGKRLDIACSAGKLCRTIDGTHQRGLSRRRRLKNLRGVFGVSGTLPRHVALVDDVITTGATAEELSQMLRNAGVEVIEIWAIARTPRDSARKG